MTELTWEYINFTPAQGTAEALGYLNEPQRQGPGEACATPRNDGSVGLFLLGPGSLGTSTTPTWEYTNFTAAQGTTGALAYLNEAQRQGPGEVSATARSDGSVGLFLLGPGSLGTSTTPTWEYTNFTAAQGPSEAVTFLNEAGGQGLGQVSAFARKDGSVSLFYLEPGSLGLDSGMSWMYIDFSPAQGTAAAVAFMNQNQLGPGAASAFARNDGSVSLFFLWPGLG